MIYHRMVVDLKLTRLKPLGLQWLVDAYSYVERNDFIQNKFSKAGISLQPCLHMFSAKNTEQTPLAHDNVINDSFNFQCSFVHNFKITKNLQL